MSSSSEMSSSSSEQPRWLTVVMAVRWPLALVAAAGILGGVLHQVLSRPIRVALVLDQPLPVNADVDQLGRPLRVAELADPIRIQAQDSVRVRGAVEIASPAPLPISGQPRVVVTDPVAIKSDTPLPVRSEVIVEARKPLPVKAEVDVEASQPLPVKGEVDVTAREVLEVNSTVQLDTDEEPVQIEFHKGLRSLF